MKKKCISYNYIIVALICQLSLCFAPINAYALNDNQKAAIINNCDTIKQTLKTVQTQDSRTRVYLGGHYEKILNNFMMNFNKRLVDNNISNTNIVDNQLLFNNTRTEFVNSFIEYQKNLDELVAIDCKNNTDDFYTKLTEVREKRKSVEALTKKMRNIITIHSDLVQAMKETL